MAYFDTKKGSLEEAIKAAVGGQINEATITFQSHDGRNKDFKNIVKKNRLKITTVGDGSQTGKDSDTVVSGDAKGIQNVLQTMYGDDWKEMYKLKGGNYVDVDEASKPAKRVFNFRTKKFEREEVEIDETNKNNKSDDGEGMDAVQPKAVKKKFADRKDKDLDNDGDTDASDKYLHKRRKAVSKAINSEKDKKEAYEYGTPEATKNSLSMTPGQSSQEWDEQVGFMHKKHNTMREAVAKMWGVEEGHNPFKKEEKVSKKESKTMTGKPATKISVNSDGKKD